MLINQPTDSGLGSPAGPAAGAPFVYVILLNWNGWQYTTKCIESLRRLNYPNYRVVVVDNGSTDESVARLKEDWADIC